MSEIRELHLSVPRTARYAVLGTPSPETRQLWFVCHGYRQLARRFISKFLCIDDGNRFVVAPEGHSRFYIKAKEGHHGGADLVGASWMTREDRESEIADYVTFLDRLNETAMRELEDAGAAEGQFESVVLGFSQGAHTVARWVAFGRVRPAHLILWGAYLPEDLPWDRFREKLAGVRLSLVRGEEDPYVSGEAHSRQEARLDELGFPFRSYTHSGGHELNRDLLLELADS